MFFDKLRYFILVPVFLMIYNAVHSIRPQSDMLVDHVWIDHVPDGYKDKFSLYIFTDQDAEGDALYGGHISGTLAKYVVETMTFKHCPAHVEMTWLADDVVSKTKYAVSEEKNGEFDLKLVIEADPRHGGQKHVYYSSTESDQKLYKHMINPSEVVTRINNNKK